MKNYMRYSSQTGLTDSDIIDMRTKAQSGKASASTIGSMYGINPTTAARIISGRSWGHVPAPKNLTDNYVIYPDGRIFAKATGSFLTTTAGKDGNMFVRITANGRRVRVPAAILVAAAFHGVDDAEKIDFANGDPEDLHFTNLVVI